MLNRKIILVAALLSFLLGNALPVQAAIGGEYGAEENVAQQGTEHKGMMKHAGEIKGGRIGFLQGADKLVDTDVRNSSNEWVGKVTDLIINNNQRTVSYVILVCCENKIHPVSWSAFDTSNEKFTLDVTKDKIMQAPSIDMIDLPLLGDPDYKQKVDSFYSEQISAVESKSPAGWMEEKMQQAAGTEEKASLVKFSQLRGLEVQNLLGERLGKVRDVLIDVRHGTVAYGMVGFGGLAGIAERTAVVPWSVFAVEQRTRIARLDTDKKTLASAELTRGQMAQLTEPQFARQLHDKFGAEPYWEVFGFVPGAETKTSTAAWQADSGYNKYFDPAKMTTIEGTIKRVSSFEPQKGAEPGLLLKLETKKGESVIVHVGPSRYAMQQNFEFKAGDNVTITGSKTSIDLKPVIMASEIRAGGRTLKLRDQQGRPLWKL